MNWFNDDPFEEILREFFGESPKSKRYRTRTLVSEEDERIIDFSEDEENVYFVFEFPGYELEDIDVIVRNGFLIVNASKKQIDLGDIQEYLVEKLKQGISIRKKLPSFINQKNFSKTMKNGVLELKFKKK